MSIIFVDGLAARTTAIPSRNLPITIDWFAFNEQRMKLLGVIKIIPVSHDRRFISDGAGGAVYKEQILRKRN